MTFKIEGLKPLTVALVGGVAFLSFNGLVQAQTSEQTLPNKTPTFNAEQSDSEGTQLDTPPAQATDPNSGSKSNTQYTPVQTRNAEDSEGEDYPIDI